MRPAWKASVFRSQTIWIVFPKLSGKKKKGFTGLAIRLSLSTGLSWISIPCVMTAWYVRRPCAASPRPSRIVYHSGMIPTVYYLEGWAQRMADFWNHFLNGKSGITVCMENVLDRYTAPFAEVCSLVEHPDFGICLDLGHIWCYSKDPLPSWIAALDGRIRHVHVHDNHRKADEHLAIGRGNLPFSQTIPVLAAQNPGLSWTIECSTKEDVLCSVAALEKISGRPVHSFNSTHSIVRSSN